MDTMLNIFSATDPAFSNITLTNLVNQNFPFIPGWLSALNLTPDQGMTTLSAAFEDVQSGIRMISSSPPGAPPSEIAHVKGDIKMLRSMHFAREITVNADELVGVRARGTMNPQTLQNLLLERTDGPVGVKMQWNLTIEHILLGLVQGRVYDADGVTVLWDYYDWTGTTQPTPITLPITTMSATTANFVTFALALKRAMTLALNGFPIPADARIIVLCGDNFFDAVTTSAEVTAARKTGAFGSTDASATISLSTPFTTMLYAGITWVNYRGTSDGLVSIATNSAAAFMAGVPGLFQKLNAPADTLEAIADNGLPYYLLNDPNRKNTDKRAVFELQANPLFANLRPAACIPIAKS